MIYKQASIFGENPSCLDAFAWVLRSKCVAHP